METSVKIAWFLIALVHLTPALTFFFPGVIDKLYGVESTGDLSVLLVHRGALFLAVFVLAIYAMLDPSARKAGVIVTAISMIAFLWLYVRAGFPNTPLRKIAIADLLGIAPLIWVSIDAFGRNSP